MKVLMIVRSTLFTSRGGDTVQVLKTAGHLNTLGIKTDIRLTQETIDYSEYDLLHFFCITRPADMLVHIKKAKKPFVVSTIFIDYGEYDQQHRRGLPGLLFRVLRVDQIEYLKTIARWVRKKDVIRSRSYWWQGQYRSIRKIVKQATLLLPNSVSEYQRLVQAYRLTAPYRVIPNAVDTALFQPAGQFPRDPNLIIAVARIEGIKNQLNLIRAVKGTRFRLLLIGAPALNQPAYYRACRREASLNANVEFMDHVPQPTLVRYYQQAAVHVLPSWFETTGLSSLEAAAMGCAIVITDRGDTREYFGQAAVYCDPASPASILKAIEKAAARGGDFSLQEKILSNYSWSEATLRTRQAYESINNLCH